MVQGWPQVRCWEVVMARGEGRGPDRCIETDCHRTRVAGTRCQPCQDSHQRQQANRRHQLAMAGACVECAEALTEDNIMQGQVRCTPCRVQASARGLAARIRKAEREKADRNRPLDEMGVRD